MSAVNPHSAILGTCLDAGYNRLESVAQRVGEMTPGEAMIELEKAGNEIRIAQALFKTSKEAENYQT